MITHYDNAAMYQRGKTFVSSPVCLWAQCVV